MTDTRAARRDSGRVVAWVRAHPVGAFLVWFFPVGWAIVFVPVVARQALSIELPLEPFVIAATRARLGLGARPEPAYRIRSHPERGAGTLTKVYV
jgi:hypothetical protein